MIAEQISSFLVMGQRVHLTSINQVLDVMEEWIILREGCKYIVATGMHGIMESRRNLLFAEALNAANLFVPDGFSLVFLARLKGFDIKDRVSGPDLMLEACRRAEVNGHSVYFYGDTEDTLKELVSRLGRDFPKLKIAGLKSPPFRELTEQESKADIDAINASGADILWVGLGLPKQEQWMYRNRMLIEVPVTVGVGAAFKFISGKSRRAPKWLGNRGFEWLWRFVFEPKRVWKRVLVDGPHFVFCCVKESLDSAKVTKPK